MRKQVVIINGSGGVGKDTFVDFVEERIKILRISSVDLIKEAGQILGWEGGKHEVDRKSLSDLKVLATAYCDSPFNYMIQMNRLFADMDAQVMFLMIREPKRLNERKRI
jgi:broad-specificity NMP kinase